MHNQKIATGAMNVTGEPVEAQEHHDPVKTVGHGVHKAKYGAVAVEGAAEGLEHGAEKLSHLRSETMRATSKGQKWTPEMKKLDKFSRAHKFYQPEMNKVASTTGKVAKVAGKAAVALKVVDAGFQVYERKNDDGKFTGKDAAAVSGSLAGGIAGGIAGAKGGAVVGAAIGSIFPGAGTLIGGAVGGVIGGIGGAIVGSFFGEKGGEYVGDKTGLDKKTVF
ncbi:MAG: hypothetical protein RDV48_26590 [Candidatus Eremiobacteraeota bacterium]|nr:hypothetical protein [Candidatus Eremiobacteraeota bacterium]